MNVEEKEPLEKQIDECMNKPYSQPNSSFHEYFVCTKEEEKVPIKFDPMLLEDNIQGSQLVARTKNVPDDKLEEKPLIVDTLLERPENIWEKPNALYLPIEFCKI